MRRGESWKHTDCVADGKAADAWSNRVDLPGSFKPQLSRKRRGLPIGPSAEVDLRAIYTDGPDAQADFARAGLWCWDFYYLKHLGTAGLVK